MYIDGDWRASVTGKSFPVTNPTSGETIAEVPDGGRADAAHAIDAADAAFAGWAGRTAYERSAILYKAWQLMQQKKEHLARTMTTEQGKPLRARVRGIRANLAQRGYRAGR